MTLPSSPNAISLSQVNVELGLSANAAISMNDAAVRTLFGVASGQISMSQGHGKSNQFAFNISANTTNANLRTLAVNAGWNQSSKVVANVASAVFISSTGTGTAALTINGSFPGGVELINNGTIAGMGGAGGTGAANSAAGTAGAAGGLALSVSSAVSITNNGTIGGGGGGGGGGQAGTVRFASGGDRAVTYMRGGGGGGGQSGTTNSAGGGLTGSDWGLWVTANPVAGSAGTSGGAGAGGAGGASSYVPCTGGAGGAGGTRGASGTTGGNVTVSGYPAPLDAVGPYSGGSGGGAVSGNANITWLAYGTRLGAIA